MSCPRIRTIPKAAQEIKEKDPNTHVTKDVLRKWVKQGYIERVPCGGVHVLINMDQLERFLNNEA